MSIRAKILIWFSLFGIIPAVLIGIFYGYRSERSVENKVLDMSTSIAGQTMLAINDRISYIEKSLNTSIQNDVIMDILDKLPQQDVVTRSFDERKIAKHFNAVVFNNPYLQSIAVVPNETQTMVYGTGTAQDRMSEHVRYFMDEKFRETELYREIGKTPNGMEWAILQTEVGNKICLVKNFSYFLYAKPMGVIVFIIDPVTFEDYLLSPPAGTSSMLVTSDNMDIGTMRPTLQKIPQGLSSEQAGVLLTEDADSFTVWASLSNGWRYSNIIPKDYLYGDIRETRANIFFFVLLTSLVFLTMAVAVSVSIGNRMNILINKFKRLETGDFTVDTVLSGGDELVTIEKSYNNMLTRLALLIDQSYVYKLEKKEAQLTALQYQINPHFLYNVLEIINSMAAVHQAEDIREVTQCLGRLYRYNMNSLTSKTTTLEDELRHIENYIYLQNIQMSGRLEVFYDIDEEARQCAVIRFILQPIVENAIKHGFSEKSGVCCLEISARIENESVLHVEVTDDGVGMDKETLGILQAELSGQEDGTKERKSGIGIRNVNARIRLKYGQGYGLSIRSEERGGTVVAIVLPSSPSPL